MNIIEALLIVLFIIILFSGGKIMKDSFRSFGSGGSSGGSGYGSKGGTDVNPPQSSKPVTKPSGSDDGTGSQHKLDKIGGIAFGGVVGLIVLGFVVALFRSRQRDKREKLAELMYLESHQSTA